MKCIARTIGEQIDHFCRISSLLKEIGTDVTHLLWKDHSQRHLDVFKAVGLPSWADVAVFFFLIDGVGKYQVEEFSDSTYLPLNEILPDIIRQKIKHIEYGHAKMEDLCSDVKEKKETQQVLNRWYPLALDMFGRTESRRSARYIEWGIKRRTNAEARRAFIEEINPLIGNLGLDVPDEKERRKYL
jgi:ring-1,2-phenylacetyl-CoA epoxidase subunit PaaA